MSPDIDRREGRGGKLMGREAKSYRPERGDRDRDGHPRDFTVDQDRVPKRHKDDRGIMGEPYGHISRAQERERLTNFGGQEYRTLMLSNFNGPASDAVVGDIIFKEFKKFGEFDFRIGHLGDDRVVYLFFRLPEDARDAKHAKQSKLILFNRPVRIEVVYSSSNTKQRQRTASSDFGLPRDTFSNRSASPPIQGIIRRGVQHVNMGHDGGFGPRSDRGNQSAHTEGYIYTGGSGNFDQRSQGSGRQAQSQNAGPKPKFPDHLTHILPEDDDKATRTLFVGNLDYAINDVNLKRIFERYGVVEDIDIKRPTKGLGNAYAFVKFINLDMAHKAKVDMSGKHIGQFQCKIGYGKVSPSTCLWVGGLGPWIQTETLEREFDRFGAIHRIVWPSGKTYAYVLYDSLDAAQAACQEMRGFHICGTDKRLRVDFADEAHLDQLAGSASPCRGPFIRDERMDNFDMTDNRDRGLLNDNNWGHDQKGAFNNDRSLNRNRGNNRKTTWQATDRNDTIRNFDPPTENPDFNRFNRRDNIDHNDNFDRRGRPPRGGFGNGNRGFQVGGRGRGVSGGHPNQGPDQNFSDQFVGHQERERSKHGNSVRGISPPNGKRRRLISPTRASGGQGNDQQQQPQLQQPQQQQPQQEQQQQHPPQVRNLNAGEADLNSRTRPGNHTDRALSQQMASVEHVDNIVDLAKCLPVVWSGALVLKNSAFAARMHIVSGAVNLVDTLMRDTTTTEMPVLRITQRLRLDQPKLEEVGRRVLTCGPNGHSVLLAKPGSSQALEDSNTMNTNAQMQQRPLKNLVSYLKQKEAAGVITLPPNPTKGRDTNTGVLYAFPPCQFGLDFLLKCAPKLAADPTNKEDHLVVVVVRAES